jgi:hypothetical protein
MRFLASFAISAALLVATAPAQAAPSKIPAGTVSNQMTCAEASAALSEISNPSSSPERILEIMNAVNQCGAKAYNDAQIANGSSMRAIPTARVQDEQGKKKVVFELVALDAKDEGALRQVCGAASSAAGVILGNGDPLITPVLTIAGEYSCGSYIDALMKDSKLLLVAPTLIPGIAITEDVLRRAGVSETDINNAKKFIEKSAAAVTNVAVAGAQAGVAVATGGLVVVDKKLKCVKILGKKICR